METIIVTNTDAIKRIVREAIREVISEEKDRHTTANRFMRVEQAADYYKVSVNTIRNWSKAGIVKSKKMGKYLFIEAQEPHKN